MTPTDVLSLRHVRALCEMIDGGDDGALSILADALEECGDLRHVGIRTILAAGYKPHRTTSQLARWSSSRDDRIGVGLYGVRMTAVLSHDLFLRLAASWTAWEVTGSEVAFEYPTLSTAYLALAEVIITSHIP